MSETSDPPTDAPLGHDEKMSVLFAQMVLQQSSLATMLLGQTPHPETGEAERELDAARVIIDQIEMLQVKTKGNLSKEEEQLLQQTLMNLRMAFVEAVDSPQPHESQGQEKPGAEQAPPQSDQQESAARESSSDSQESEPRSRFSKKYGSD